ncbi:ROK family protein [Rhodococcus opacus]|uniref:ROK family protein n=1 Tax=Rhodococcus opacus TaxID=37919 RepID=UPI002955C5B4|nr:ROK family protein [Rhodococcus opacus]MDV7088989.1 ROK family protein [Rhodococcus opacus]
MVLIAGVSVNRAHIAIADFAQRILAEDTLALDIGQGPVPVLDAITTRLAELSQTTAMAGAPLQAMVIGLPGPVDPGHGRPVRPPIMPGWDDFPVATHLSASVKCRVIVENDANIRALGEARAVPEDQLPMVYLTIGAGIGHIRVPRADDVVCVCGNVGCVEAVASTSAILRQLSEQHTCLASHSQPTLMNSHNSCDRAASVVRMIRKAAIEVGEAVAMLVHVFNPKRIVIGGPSLKPAMTCLAGICSVVYQRAHPLATRNLMIGNSSLGESAGLADALSPDGVAGIYLRAHCTPSSAG